MNNLIKDASYNKYSEINIGDVHEFEKVITKEDIETFAGLTGDYNPLHVNEDFAKNTSFKKNVVHGMLAGSLFSTLVGMYCPGRDNLYLAQSLNFVKPIFPGDRILVRGTIKNKIDAVKMILMKTEILKDSAVVINGEAKVKVLGDQG